MPALAEPKVRKSTPEPILRRAVVGRDVRVYPSIVRDYRHEVYRPRKRSATALALVGALGLHALMILIVGLEPPPPAAVDLQPSEHIAEVVFESGPAEPEPEHPAVEEPFVADAPPPSTERPEFVEENSTPPPERKPRSGPVGPLARPRGAGLFTGTATMSSAKAVAISAPRPEYPYEARRNRTTGSGIVMMTVDPATGSVTDVSMAQSTGSPMLDNAALSAFRRWRFRAGTVTRVRTPITFTMTGAQY